MTAVYYNLLCAKNVWHFESGFKFGEKRVVNNKVFFKLNLVHNTVVYCVYCRFHSDGRGTVLFVAFNVSLLYLL